MNPWRWVDPRVRQVKIANLQGYLLGHGWVLRPNPNRQLLRFERVGDGAESGLFQMIPAHDEPSEYPQRIVEFITTLSELEDRHPVAVLEDILQALPEANHTDTKRAAIAKTG